MQALSKLCTRPINIGQRKKAEMKSLKILIIGLLIYCFIGLWPLPVKAGNELDDYLFQYEKYQDIYDQFVLARDKFLKYQVLNIRQQAAEATKTFLLQRNQVLRTYFLLLNNKFRTTSGVISSEQKEGLMSQLDKKIIWLEEESEEVQKVSTPDLEELFILSDRIEDKQAELKGLGYQSWAEILLGKIRNLQQESVGITTLLKDDVFQNKSATKAAQLDLWLREVSVQNYLAQKEIEAAEINLWKLKAANQEQDMLKNFNNLKIDVNDAKIYLNQAVSFQKEIVAELNHE